MYSTCGVLPVPPAERFPTTITGTSNSTWRSMPQSKNLLRNHVAAPYNLEHGSNTVFATRFFVLILCEANYVCWRISSEVDVILFINVRACAKTRAGIFSEFRWLPSAPVSEPWNVDVRRIEAFPEFLCPVRLWLRLWLRRCCGTHRTEEASLPRIRV